MRLANTTARFRSFNLTNLILLASSTAVELRLI
jgi:hypothetical protein